MSNYDLISCKHSFRSNTFQELEKCFETKKETLDNIIRLNKKYKEEKFEDIIPLIESGIIVRDFNNKNLMKTMNIWFDMILNYSHRDQLSFGYSVWKNNIKVNLLDINQYDNKYFKMNNHYGVNEINIVYIYGQSKKNIYNLLEVKKENLKILNNSICFEIKKSNKNNMIKIFIDCKDNEAFVIKNYNKSWEFFNVLVHNNEIILNNKSFIAIEDFDKNVKINLNITGYHLLDLYSKINEENNVKINELNSNIIDLNKKIIEMNNEIKNLKRKFSAKIASAIKKIKISW